MSPSYKINFVVYVVYLWMRITVIQLVFYLISEMSDIVKVCHVCAKSSIDFTHVQNFYAHVNSHKVVPSNCSICDKTFPTKIALHRHTTNVHSDTTFSCEVCDKNFSTKSNLSKHMKQHSRTVTPQNKEKGIFPCPDCGKEYSYQYGLNEHMKKYHTYNEVSCSTCDYIFKTASDLNRHVTDNDNQGPIENRKCNKCKKVLSSVSYLKHHMMMQHKL